MLLELCVTELEDVASDSQSGRLSSQPVVVESSHPYTDDTSSSGTVKIPGVCVGRACPAGRTSGDVLGVAIAAEDRFNPHPRLFSSWLVGVGEKHNGERNVGGCLLCASLPGPEPAA